MRLQDLVPCRAVSWKSSKICEFSTLVHGLRVSQFVDLAPLNGKELRDFWIWRPQCLGITRLLDLAPP